MGSSDIKKGVAESEPNSELNQQFSPPKGLMALVIIMGIMIIVGTGALIWVIVHRMTHIPSEAAVAKQPHIDTAHLSDTPALLNIPRRTDEHIQSVTARHDGSLSVLLVSSKSGERILVWLPEQARIVAEFDLSAGNF